MSILIRGMEMPRSCFYCQFQHKNTTECLITHKYYNWGLTTSPSDCPLVEIPPHGRLIDADALTQQIMMKADATCGWADALDLALAPTIIESEWENG